MKKIICGLLAALAAFCFTNPALADVLNNTANTGLFDFAGMGALAFAGVGSTRLQKVPCSKKRVGSASGGVAVNAGQISIALPKGLLVEEYKLNVGVSQTWGTNAPSSSDVRRFFSKIELQSSSGTMISLDFHQFYDLARFTESSSAPVVALGAGGGAAATAQFAVDLHLIMDECVHDLMTALNTAELSSLSLVLTPAPDASNGFIGGTGTVGAAAYTVTVDQKALPGFAVKTQFDHDKHGYGRAVHRQMSIGEIVGGAAVTSQSFKMKSGCKTRFIILHTYSITGSALANGIIDKITLSVPGHEYYTGIDAFAIQQDNIKGRGFSQSGVVVLDQGDDPTQWIDTRGLSDILVEVTTLATAPASWRVTCAQDSAEGLEKYHY